MSSGIVLASASPARAAMLRNAGAEFEVAIARVDEISARQALEQEGASPRDIADALAELKARKISQNRQDSPVIGCDQVLEFNGKTVSKSASVEAIAELLSELNGKTHTLYSAAVIYQQGRPVWRAIGDAKMTMRQVPEQELEDYVKSHGKALLELVGGYKVEAEGIRLFSRIDGDYFSVIGMPLLAILNFLAAQGALDK